MSRYLLCHAICYVTLSSHQLNSKHKATVFLFRYILSTLTVSGRLLQRMPRMDNDSNLKCYAYKNRPKINHGACSASLMKFV